MPWFWSKMQTRFASRSIFGKEMLGYPLGSFQEIFDVLRERVEGAGGRVLLETRVESFPVENGRAVGVAGRGRDDAGAGIDEIHRIGHRHPRWQCVAESH